MRDNSYNAVMNRKNEIMKNAIGIDYSAFENEGISFDYEKMMIETGYSLDEMEEIQSRYAVGKTPIIELRKITN